MNLSAHLIGARANVIRSLYHLNQSTVVNVTQKGTKIVSVGSKNDAAVNLSARTDPILQKRQAGNPAMFRFRIH